MELITYVDEVAYVRFASVYREFKDTQTFMKELQHLLNGILRVRNRAARAERLFNSAEAELFPLSAVSAARSCSATCVPKPRGGCTETTG